MGVCLSNIEMVVRNRSFFIDFALVCSEKGATRKNVHSNQFPYSWQTQWCKLQLHIAFCLQVTIVLISTYNLFFLYLLYKLIFQLLLCRAVTLKAIGV